MEPSSPASLANEKVSSIARLTALGCFFFAALAIPWLAVGTYGASWLIRSLLHAGEWSALGLIFGLPIVLVSLIPVALGRRRFRIGRELWQGSRSVAERALRLANVTLTLNLITLALCVTAEMYTYREKGRFDHGDVLVIIIVMASLALIAICHAILLRRVSAALFVSRNTTA